MASNDGDWKRLVKAGPAAWSVGEVAMWMEFVGMTKHKLLFIENDIAGEELLDLEDEDLVSLGVDLLGNRKKLLKLISGLRNGTVTRIESDDTASNSSSTSDSKGTIAVKLYYNQDISRINVKKDITLDKFKRQISKEFGGRKMSFKIRDEDDDLMRVRTTSTLQNMLETLRPPVRIVVNRRRTKRSKSAKEAQFLSDAQEAAYGNLIDAVIVIDNDGSIKFANEAVSKLFGYATNFLKNKNVNILMPEPYCTQHDSYLSTYHDTKRATVIGTSRTVIGKHKDGNTINLRLSVTLHKDEHGVATGFVGTLVPVKANTTSSTSGGNDWSGLDTLLESALVADIVGDIVYVNKAAMQFFGCDSKGEIVGQNLEILMPSPHSENHRKYLNNYQLTKKKTVIGKTREVLAEKFDGTIVPVILSVNEQQIQDKVFFTGIVKPITMKDNDTQPKQSALTQNRDVINSLCIPGIIIDKDGLIQAFNTAASKLLGYQLNEIMGKNISTICPPVHAEKHDQYLSNYLSTGVKKVIGKERILQAKHKNGSLTSIQLSVTECKNESFHFFTGMLHAAK